MQKRKRTAYLRFTTSGQCVLWLLSQALVGRAQTAPADSLNSHLHLIERQLDTLSWQVTELEREGRQQSRRSTENAQDGRFVVRGLQKDTYLTIGGFVQADAIYSLRPLGQEIALLPSSIPVPNGHTASSSLSVNPSRLYVRSLTQLPRKQLFKTYLELDLFNANGSTTPRLRHAWATFGAFGVGQTWSLFTDSDAFPDILEFNGPNAMALVRQAQLRYSIQLNPKWQAAISIEQPGSKLRFADSTGRYVSQSLYPDAVGMLRLGATSNNHIEPDTYLRFAALLHPLTYRDQPADALTTYLGWGLNLSGILRVGRQDLFTFQTAYGKGMARYINDVKEAALDAWLPPAGPLRPLPTLALYAFYDHVWVKHWSSTVGAGHVRLRPAADEPATTFLASNYGIVNLLFVPLSFLKMGIEYQYGAHRSLTEEHGQGSRIQLTVQNKF